MAGISIYLTEQEQDMLIEYATQAISILGEAEGTWEQTEDDLKNGLGSAMYKIYKGRNGQRNYKQYKRRKGGADHES